MPHTRLITVVLIDQGFVVQTRGFKRTNVIGSAYESVDFFNTWAVDEIITLEISHDRLHLEKFRDVIRRLSRRCFVPLTVGGKIRTFDDAAAFIGLGADKVVINTGAVQSPSLITEIAG